MIQPPNQNIDKDWFLEHHIMMHRIRAFEETAAKANKDKLVLGAIHLSIGQEAIASGVCKNLMKKFSTEYAQRPRAYSGKRRRSRGYDA